MTRNSGKPPQAVISGRIGKPPFKNHVHLTSNIHLRNHQNMQKHRMVAEARHPLVKELTVLRRAKSLRDPSTSPSWASATFAGRRTKEGNQVKRDEIGDVKSADSQGESQRSKLTENHLVDVKREKLDVRAELGDWVGELLRDDYWEGSANEVGPLARKSEAGRKQSKPNGKMGMLLEKSKSYPRFGNAQLETPQNAKALSVEYSGKRPQHFMDNFLDVATPAASAGGARRREDGGSKGRAAEERMRKGNSRREIVRDETRRRAEIARRVISEAGFEIRDSVPTSTQVSKNMPSGSHVPSAVPLQTSVKSGGEEEEFVYSDKEESFWRNGVQQPPLHLDSHSKSPLLFRDSMNNEWATLGRRSGQTPLVARELVRHRERIALRVAPRGRLRGTRTSARASATSSDGNSIFGMEGELEVSELPRHGCGPWYWSRMHKYKGRRILDMAGKSLACGFPDPSKRKGEKQHDTRSECSLRRDMNGRGEFGLDSSSFPAKADYHDNYDDGDSVLGSPRADGNLLVGDPSGELVFGSTRDELSGALIPSSSPGFISDIGGVLATRTEIEMPRSFSQKYRPKVFGELVGQNMVAKSLSTAVFRRKIAPVYLFQGPRGTGKTSAARIFAQAVNCVTDKVDGSRPCGVCRECSSHSPDVREIDAASNSGIECVKALLGSMAASPSSSRCKIFIIEGCHLLTTEAWNAFLKALEEPPWHVVFILITTDPEKLPRTATSRCQKFLFTKIKEADIVSRLQILVSKEGMEVDESALALIATRSDGSLRDAETTLDQLSLLGKKVNLPMVQELVGLVSNDKLVDLLDLALSADAVNTVRCMRELLDGSVEPLALVSQLATLITDILVGTFVVPRDRQMKGFFFRRISKKEEALRLRHALKVLSEAEKQLRVSSDQPTWLTAALLQIAPDRSFQPSSLETSVVQSPVAVLNSTSEKETVGGESAQPWTREEPLATSFHPEKVQPELSGRLGPYGPFPDIRKKPLPGVSFSEAKVHPTDSPLVVGVDSPDGRRSGRPSNARSDEPLLPGHIDDLNHRDFSVVSQRKLEEIWQRVLQGSRSNVLRQLLQGQGKLLSLAISEAYAIAYLEFRHPEHKARAERSRSRICNAFQITLGRPVELKISLACMPSEKEHERAAFSLPSFEEQGEQESFGSWQKEKAKFKASTERKPLEARGSLHGRRRPRNLRTQRSSDSMEIPQALYNAVMGDSKAFKPEILPVVGSSKWSRNGQPEDPAEMSWAKEAKRYALQFQESQKGTRSGSETVATVARANSGKVLLKTAIHQPDDITEPSAEDQQTDILCGPARNRKKSVKFREVGGGKATNVELENLRLESRLKPGALLCWKAQKFDEDKIKQQRRRRQRRVRFLLRLVPCAKSKTPKQSSNTEQEESADAREKVWI